MGKARARKKARKDLVDESQEPAQQQTLPSSVANSPLFKLPPELRNMIYRYAIISNTELPISKSHGIPEAPLLQVNKLIRSETYELFYLENKFTCVVHNYDPASLMLSHRRWQALYQIPGTSLNADTGTISIDLQGNRNWDNLVAWFRFVHEVACCGMHAMPDDDAEQSLMTGLFKMIMHGPEMDLSALDFLLESTRPTFVNLHKDWGKD